MFFGLKILKYLSNVMEIFGGLPEVSFKSGMAPQTHLWLIEVWFPASTFVVKIANFAIARNRQAK
jgi:hypothetical protein